MNNLLFEALENCLLAIEQGSDIETALISYPDLADELRPILETSIHAKSQAVPVPSADVLRRSRAKFLQRAAQMREAKVKPGSRRIWFAALRRGVVTLVVLAMVFASGTGLVRASSTTLPGDNLYPVKRSWENVLVFFTFDPNEREVLEVEQENERLDEMHELFAKGRSSQVDFAGVVTGQNKDQWMVAGFPIIISSQAILPAETIAIGAAVRVVGQTQVDGTIFAQQIILLPPGANLPVVEDNSSTPEVENTQEANQPGEDQSGEGSGDGTSTPAPIAIATKTPKPEFEPKAAAFEGVVESMDGDMWTINGNLYDVSTAEIIGTPASGAIAKVEGYVNEQGIFIVIKIEFGNNGSGSGDSVSNDNHRDGGGDQSNDNSNDNSNHHEDDNGNGNDG